MPSRNTYSLAKYILSIAIPTELVPFFGETLSIGGQGSYLGQITLSLNENLWSTSGDYTGSFVHNKNLNKTGSCTVSIQQISEMISKFKTLCNVFYNNDEDYDGLTLTLSTLDQTKIATCESCFIQKIPDQNFGTTSASQDWVFTCGAINFN